MEGEKMSNVFRLRLRNPPSREHARLWLATNVTKFPKQINNFIGPEMFHGWRFITPTEGETYFANCIDRGISEKEFFGDCYLAQK